MLPGRSLRDFRRHPLPLRRQIPWAGHAVPLRRRRQSTMTTLTPRLLRAALLLRLQLSRSQRPLWGLRTQSVIRATLTRSHGGLLGGVPGLSMVHLGTVGRLPGRNKNGPSVAHLPAPGQRRLPTTTSSGHRTAHVPPTWAGLRHQGGLRWRQALARSRCRLTQFGTRTCRSCLPLCLTQTRPRAPLMGRSRCGTLRVLREPAPSRTPGSRAWVLMGAMLCGATLFWLRTRA